MHPLFVIVQRYVGEHRELGEQQDIIAADTYGNVMALGTDAQSVPDSEDEDIAMKYIAALRYLLATVSEGDVEYELAVFIAAAAILPTASYKTSLALTKAARFDLFQRLKEGVAAIVAEVESKIPSMAD
jgi:hypothetical protein